MTVIFVTVRKVEYILDELVVAVAARLAAAGLDRQDNGQVSAFPDRRTLRYYTTIGLMDRPDTVRHRQAIYGERHVTQAVAVKRLQASGLPLAAIQARLAGLPSAAVDAIASAHAEVSGTGSSGATAGTGSPVTAAAAGARPHAATRRMAAQAGPAAPPPDTEPDLHRMVAVALTADTTLLLTTDRSLSADDVSAIRDASAALLSHLAAAGLTGATHQGRESR
ncbi:MAG: hypothetical protein QOK39_1182 [Acidimicrobiaceae bacterium]|jgi:DNA-binding transcriptional MerR regulator|nr:hypothetical protein [Acidimicrobiaceae bacterium]